MKKIVSWLLLSGLMIQPIMAMEQAPIAWFDAAIYGNIQQLQQMINEGINVNAMDHPLNNTALMFTAVTNNLEMVRILLGAGANPNLQNLMGTTALMNAAQNNHPDVVRELIRAGANPNMPDSIGRTALMIAAQNNHPEMVKILLATGADPSIQDNTGMTAYDLAATEEIKDIIKDSIIAQWNPYRLFERELYGR